MGNAAGLDVGLRNLHSLDKGKVVISPGAVGSGGVGSSIARLSALPGTLPLTVFGRSVRECY